MSETTINDAPTIRDEAAGNAGRLRSGDEILGRYVVESELGQGGMGVVYKCLDRVGRVEVAVKGLPPEVSHNVDEMELFAGRLPFDGDDLTVLCQAVLNAPAPKIPTASSVVNAALAKALAKKPEDRFSSCAAFVAAFAGKVRVVPKRPVGKAIAVASLLVFLAGGGLVYKHQVDRQEAARVAKVAADEKAKAEAKQPKPQSVDETEVQQKIAELRRLRTLIDIKRTGLREAVEKVAPYRDDTDGLAAHLAAVDAAAKEVENAKDPADVSGAKALAERLGKAVDTVAVELKWLETNKAARDKAKAIDGKIYTSPVELKNLEKGRRFASLSASYEAAGKRYRQTFVSVDVDWIGPKTLALALPEVKEPMAGTVKEIELSGGVKMKFVWCPPGSFTMGSPTDEDELGDDETQHPVTLTKGFWMGQYEVTQAQWRSVMGDNPSNFRGDDDRPVERVSWEDCQKFVEKCNAVVKNVRFVLPTEAQWEYACRAGSTGPFAGTGDLAEMGWCSYNGGEKTHPVGQKKPNAWNLYDMHGNVCEWCADWYGTYEGDSTDPTGPASGESRVLRGGGWDNGTRDCRSASRNWFRPGCRYYDIGFRLLCSAGPHE
ncbi:MAG: SUMF1/EgtB/PvdO family nonheme iron enzyme [Kiritimatiellae bacterium]|nr:SUMF1/EgtB/PvdO family nonheme iron enzyme [Kiritimatiellia bacterium]